MLASQELPSVALNILKEFDRRIGIISFLPVRPDLTGKSSDSKLCFVERTFTTDSISLLVTNFYSDFLLIPALVFVAHTFLGIYPFHLGNPVFVVYGCS